jgi:hypothetical protein
MEDAGVNLRNLRNLRIILVSRKDAKSAKVRDVFAMVFFAALACLARSRCEPGFPLEFTPHSDAGRE